MHWPLIWVKAGRSYLHPSPSCAALHRQKHGKRLDIDWLVFGQLTSSCSYSICGLSHVESRFLQWCLSLLCSILQHLPTAAWQLWPSNRAKHWVTTSRAHPVGLGPLGSINRKKGLESPEAQKRTLTWALPEPLCCQWMLMEELFSTYSNSLHYVKRCGGWFSCVIVYAMVMRSNQSIKQTCSSAVCWVLQQIHCWVVLEKKY